MDNDDKQAHIARGFAIAQEVTLAALNDDSAGALRVINAASQAELGWAVARMMTITRELAIRVVGGDVEVAREVMAAAFTEDDDLIATQLRSLSGETDLDE